jgi:hypothetical protein
VEFLPGRTVAWLGRCYVSIQAEVHPLKEGVMGQGSGVRALGSIVLLGAVVLAGCGGGGKSGSPTASSSTQTLKRVDVHVVGTGAAEGPRQSMLARIGNLIGWPQVAEASAGIAGCTVNGGGAPQAITDANGNASLVGVVFPATVIVACPGGQTGSFPVTGVAGAIVKVEAEVGSIEVKVKNQKVSEPKVSEPSKPSKPPGTLTTSSHHGSGDDD